MIQCYHTGLSRKPLLPVRKAIHIVHLLPTRPTTAVLPSDPLRIEAIECYPCLKPPCALGYISGCVRAAQTREEKAGLTLISFFRRMRLHDLLPAILISSCPCFYERSQAYIDNFWTAITILLQPRTFCTIVRVRDGC
jgi:hypothetical protein